MRPPPRLDESRQVLDAGSSAALKVGPARNFRGAEARAAPLRWPRRRGCEPWVVRVTTCSNEEYSCGREYQDVSLADRAPMCASEPTALVACLAACKGRSRGALRTTTSGPLPNFNRRVDYLVAMRLLFRAWRCGLLLVLGTTGCARHYADPVEPPAPGQAPSGTSLGSPARNELDSLEHELAIQEQRVADYLAAGRAEFDRRSQGELARDLRKSEASEEPTTLAPQRARPAAPKRERGAGPADPEDTASAETASPEGSGDACDLACRALSSMRRSADRICAIAGDDDPRCTHARARVEDASSRVARASCACSED